MECGSRVLVVDFDVVVVDVVEAAVWCLLQKNDIKIMEKKTRRRVASASAVARARPSQNLKIRLNRQDRIFDPQKNSTDATKSKKKLIIFELGIDNKKSTTRTLLRRNIFEIRIAQSRLKVMQIIGDFVS